jgi:hypothetical protein
MKKNILFLLLFSFLFIGCKSLSPIIEKDNIMNFHTEIIEENVIYINISGHIGWSAIFYDRIETKVKNDELYIIMYGTILKKYKNSSGTFNINIPIDRKINKIYFGEGKNIIRENNITNTYLY